MYFKAPSPDGAWNLYTFINPFHRYFWFTLLANMLFSALVLYATYYFRVSRQDRTKTETREKSEFSFVDSFFTAFSAQVQQGKI